MYNYVLKFFGKKNKIFDFSIGIVKFIFVDYK